MLRSDLTPETRLASPTEVGIGQSRVGGGTPAPGSTRAIGPHPSLPEPAHEFGKDSRLAMEHRTNAARMAIATTVSLGACDVAAVRYLLTEAGLNRARVEPIDVGELTRYDRPALLFRRHRRRCGNVTTKPNSQRAGMRRVRKDDPSSLGSGVKPDWRAPARGAPERLLKLQLCRKPAV